jgi:hypothetical protein
MTQKAEKAGPVGGTDLRITDLAIGSENSTPLELQQALRLNRQYGFAIETAATIASLAWGLAR